MATPRVVGFSSTHHPDKDHPPNPRGRWETVTEPLQVPSVAVPQLEATCTATDPTTPTSVASSGCRRAGALSTAMHATPAVPDHASLHDVHAARMAVAREELRGGDDGACDAPICTDMPTSPFVQVLRRWGRPRACPAGAQTARWGQRWPPWSRPPCRPRSGNRPVLPSMRRQSVRCRKSHQQWWRKSHQYQHQRSLHRLPAPPPPPHPHPQPPCQPRPPPPCQPPPPRPPAPSSSCAVPPHGLTAARTARPAPRPRASQGMTCSTMRAVHVLCRLARVRVATVRAPPPVPPQRSKPRVEPCPLPQHAPAVHPAPLCRAAVQGTGHARRRGRTQGPRPLEGAPGPPPSRRRVCHNLARLERRGGVLSQTRRWCATGGAWLASCALLRPLRARWCWWAC